MPACRYYKGALVEIPADEKEQAWAKRLVEFGALKEIDPATVRPHEKPNIFKHPYNDVPVKKSGRLPEVAKSKPSLAEALPDKDAKKK
jgi:hypothetical protein